MIAAEMTGGDVAAVIVAIASVAAVVLLVIVVISVTRTLTAVRLSVEQLRREALPVLDEAHRALTKANGELERVDDLLDTAQSVGSTVDSASHLAYLVVSNPVIKGVAVASGTARAFRAFRRR